MNKIKNLSEVTHTCCGLVVATEVTAWMDSTPVAHIIRSLGRTLYRKAGVVRQAFVVIGRLSEGSLISIKVSLRVALGLQLLPHLINQLIFALVLLLQVDHMGLHRHFFIPHTTVVLPQTLSLLALLSKKLIYQRITLFQNQICIFPLMILNILVPLVDIILPNSFLFPGRIEVSNDFGLLGGKINFVSLQLLEYAIANDIVLFLGFGFPCLRRQVELEGQLLSFLLVHLGYAAVGQRIASYQNSHLQI